MAKVIDFAAVRASKGLVVPEPTKVQTAATVPAPAPGLHGYYPEMGDKKPVCQMEASLSHNGKHYFIDTPLVLSPGRGIEYLGTYRPQDLTPQGQRKVGWGKYKVTCNAFEKLKREYSVSYQMLLD